MLYPLSYGRAAGESSVFKPRLGCANRLDGPPARPAAPAAGELAAP